MDHQYKIIGSAKDLGGAFDKYKVQGPSGESMFKPALTLGGAVDPLKAFVDQTASNVQKIVTPDAAVTATAVKLTVPGKGEMLGSIQPLKTDFRKNKDFLKNGAQRDFNARPFEEWEVKGLQQAQVLDWLIANHDSHAGQFLRVNEPGGPAVIGIDKTQAFRFIGKDELSTAYHPNTMEKAPLYNTLFQSIKDGKTSFDPMNSLPAIQKAQSIPDNDYKKMLMPYVAARFNNVDDANKFLQMAVDRKNNLKTDFEKFYSDVLGKNFTFPKNSTAIDDQGVAVVDQSHKFQGPNPAPDFSQKYPVQIQAMVDHASSLLSSGTKIKFDDDYEINKYQTALSLGKTPEEAAEGRGGYVNIMAKFGVDPQSMKEVHSAIHAWSGDAAATDTGPLRKASQEIVNGKCCSSPFSKAVMVEYAVTQAHLQQDHPNGKINMDRYLKYDVAKSIKNALDAGAEFVNVKLLNADGWSDAEKYGHGKYATDAVRLYVTHDTKNVISSWRYTSSWSFGSAEMESMVAVPGAEATIHKSKIKVY